MSRTKDVGNALIGKLGADAPLLALMPNGVYRQNRAPAGSTRLVEIAFVPSSHDEPMFGGRAWEDLTFIVKAVERVRRDGGVSRVGDAAARIDALLEHGRLTLAGYGVMVMRRTEYLEDTELDGTDYVWEHCGGYYQVMVAPAAT
jgi:hypothetical protein